MEIERKYSIKIMPENLSAYQKKKIEQGYLCHKPVLRIRKSNDDYYITYKSKLGLPKREEGSAIVQNEVELPLTKEAYEHLCSKTDGNMVYKTRYLIPLNNRLTAELDIFEGVLTGLFFAEVEFPDEDTANHFIPPEWFGEDISDDKRFSNYNLSKLSGLNELNLNSSMR